jgi:hypothetical protein
MEKMYWCAMRAGEFSSGEKREERREKRGERREVM